MASVITGKVINTETKTGTVEEPNQNSAIKIKETTGVDLIVIIHGCKAAENAGKMPAAKPRIPESNNDNIKANKPRKQVVIQRLNTKRNSIYAIIEP